MLYPEINPPERNGQVQGDGSISQRHAELDSASGVVGNPHHVRP